MYGHLARSFREAATCNRMRRVFDLAAETGAQLMTFTLARVFDLPKIQGFQDRVRTVNEITRRLAADYSAVVVEMWDVLELASAHGGAEYERLEDAGRLVLQLHRWDVDHHHGPLGDPEDRPYGNGVAIWFEVDDLVAAVARAHSLGAQVVREVHVNPNAGHRELWLHDLDGYLVVLASHDGDP